MPAWKIYYGDGTTYGSADGQPEDAPCRDVQLIVAMVDGRRVILHGGGPVLERTAGGPGALGYYWFEHNEWYIGDYVGMLDYLMEPGHKTVKFGRSIPTERFHAIVHRAQADTDFPRPR